MKKLTYRQRQALADLTNPNSYSHQAGITNPTLSALQNRGLVTHRTIEKKVTLQYDDWQLTAAGKEALKS